MGFNSAFKGLNVHTYAPTPTRNYSLPHANFKETISILILYFQKPFCKWKNVGNKKICKPNMGQGLQYLEQ
jgi:hypothetical protein